MDHGCRTCSDLRDLLTRERERARAAEAASAAKDRLLEVTAGESSSLIQSLLGWTQTLQRGVLSNETRANALKIMEQRLTAHLELLGELLDASGSAPSQLHLGAFDLGAAIRRVLEHEAAAALERSVVASAVIPAALPLVLGDRARLENALQRLVRETCSLTAPGGAVSARVNAEHDHVRVVIESHEAKESLPQTSLAVALARTTARVHAGSLDVSPTATTMRIPAFLPAVSEPAANRDRRDRKAVVVSPEPDLAELLGLTLRGRGVTALLAADEELAVQACRVHAPDLLIVGNQQAANRLTAQLPGSDLRVLVVGDAPAIATELAPVPPGSM